MADGAVQTELRWRTLTPAINEMKSPNQFLKKLLYPNHQTVPTETIDLSFNVRGRQMAPLVRKGAEGVLVAGASSTFATVTGPNIRIKMPFNARVLFERQPGYSLHPSKSEQLSAVQASIARDVKCMADDITNREEWMCAMALQGEILYSVDGDDTYKITYPIPAGNQITLSTFWNTTVATTNMQAAFLQAKKVMSDEVGLVPTDVILGSEAMDTFLDVIRTQQNAATSTVYQVGTVDMGANYTEDGAIYLGRFCQVNVWGYPRTIVENDGTTVNLIRAKYAEFVNTSSASERVLYYAAIEDLDAYEQGLIESERFLKTFKTADPSQITYLAHSRPLPVPRRAGATVSMKVISG